MLRKESLLGWSAVSDAFATFFALSPQTNDTARRPGGSVQERLPGAQAMRTVVVPDTFSRAENSTRAVIGVVIVLIFATGILFALDFPVLVNAVRASKGFALDWRLFRIPA